MRRKDREITDVQEILRIAGTAKILHLGFFDGEYPYIVPLHYGYTYAHDQLVFYMHGSKEGHKIDLLEGSPNVCIELECNVELISGKDVPCRYGSAYASIIGRGKAELVTDSEEKIEALKVLMKHQTGRDFEFTVPMAAAVAIIKVTVLNYTAKARKI